MIQFVQTGEYRTRSIRIKRFINGIEITGEGFPIVESLLDPFGSEIQISESQLIDFTQNEFTARVEAFKLYLLGKYSWLSPTDFSNLAGGTDNVACVIGNVTGTGTIPITQDTEITIFFDSSGSMSATLAPLLEMRNTLLKAALLPFYNMDTVLFDSKVRVVSDGSERTMHLLNNRAAAMAQNHLIMVFQDEANTVYHTSQTISPRTATFDTDINSLKSTILSRQANSYRGILFQVTRSAGEGTQFKAFAQAVENGNAAYPLPYNLSDRAEVAFQYDVSNGQNAQYYMDIIILKMQQLGYRL